MKLNLVEVKKRLRRFLINDFSDQCGHFKTLISNCRYLEEEERLFYVLLATHFDSPDTAKDFYQKLTWKELQQGNENQYKERCRKFFNEKRLIGNHRRHFRCMRKEEKVKYTVEILNSYRKVIRQYGSQVDFFEINKNPVFDTLYHRMTEIAHFETRLPRFDHLERVSRTHNFYVIPDRFYSEDSSGPLDGLTYLFFGKKYRRNKMIFDKYFVQKFPREWNSKVERKYQISPVLLTVKDAIQALERWAIGHAKEKIPLDKFNNDFVFDFESCLCNWQKRK